jgi:hypothetical protein
MKEAKLNRERNRLLTLAKAAYANGDIKTGDFLALKLVNLHQEGIATAATALMETLKPRKDPDGE